jgi:hypothetical protein
MLRAKSCGVEGGGEGRQCIGTYRNGDSVAREVLGGDANDSRRTCATLCLEELRRRVVPALGEKGEVSPRAAASFYTHEDRTT